MSTKRIKDPAGLLPDHVTIDFTDPSPDDAEQVVALLEWNTPGARIERLRRHPELVDLSERLAAKLSPEEGATEDLLIDISGAEVKAIYLDTLPAVIEKKRRADAASPLSDGDIQAALSRHRFKKDAAEELGLSPRQLRTRINKMKKRKS